MLAWAGSRKNTGAFNFHPEEPTEYNLSGLLVSCFKTQCFRPGLWALKLCLDPSSSHWHSDTNDPIFPGKSPSDTCPITTVCKARDVILSISKFLVNPLVSFVLTNLKTESLNLCSTLVPPWDFEVLLLTDTYSPLTSCIFRNQCGQRYHQQSDYSPIFIPSLPWDVWNSLLSLSTCDLSSKMWLEVTVMSPDFGNSICLDSWVKIIWSKSTHPKPHSPSIEMQHEWEKKLLFF